MTSCDDSAAENRLVAHGTDVTYGAGRGGALSGVAAHLTSALDVLLLSGCDWPVAEPQHRLPARRPLRRPARPSATRRFQPTARLRRIPGGRAGAPERGDDPLRAMGCDAALSRAG